MKLHNVRVRQTALAGAISLFGGLAAVVTAPTAVTAPDCSQERLSDTVGTTTSATRSYLDSHPGARAVFDAAPNQSRPEAAANIRTYFTAHPTEYHELRGILAPIGNAQRECNVTVLPADLASAYDEFMTG